jgi:hypothetical protein
MPKISFEAYLHIPVSKAEEETLLQGGTIETSDVEFKDTFFFADVNDYCVHSDGHMSGYLIDKEQGSVTSSFCALISRSLVRRSLPTYPIVCLRTEPSLIDLWSWSVSRWCFQDISFLCYLVSILPVARL